jgi:hypothetical protein
MTIITSADNFILFVQCVRDKAVVLRKPITVSPLHKSGKAENNK